MFNLFSSFHHKILERNIYICNCFIKSFQLLQPLFPMHLATKQWTFLSSLFFCSVILTLAKQEIEFESPPLEFNYLSLSVLALITCLYPILCSRKMSLWFLKLNQKTIQINLILLEKSCTRCSCSQKQFCHQLTINLRQRWAVGGLV